MKTRHVPTPFQDSPGAAAEGEPARLVLRDGSTATVRGYRPEDLDRVTEFFHTLSPESRQRRFFAAFEPGRSSVARMCDSADPGTQMTLLVTRFTGEDERVIAMGSYNAAEGGSAELALAVEDPYQGKGLGSLLLERLAAIAVAHGITRFNATTQCDNAMMMDVIRSSGLTFKAHPDGGFIDAELSVLPGAESVTRNETRDRAFTATSLRPFFHPRGIAVIGASRDPAAIGHRIMRAVIHGGFQGPVYPVNPSATVVCSIRAYTRVQEVPDPVDLAVIAVPARAVIPVLEECAERSIRAAVVVSAGFAETGPAGRELQESLTRKARSLGMRVLGPNCLGVQCADPEVLLNASFSPVFAPAGPVAMASQSGALGLAILSRAQELGLGIASFASMGNKADVSGNDLIQYWEEDPATRVIMLYLESFGNPRRFARIARRVARVKPIIAVKGGRTRAGRRAASSHTAALAGVDTTVDALFHQSGVIRVDSLEEMFDLGIGMAHQPLPAGGRVAILTNAGGPGILCADACEAGGLTIPALGDGTQAELSRILAREASLGNPVDMIASAGPAEYRGAVSALLASSDVDCLIVLFIPLDLARAPEILDAICQGIQAARATAGAGKPVLVSLIGSGAQPPPLGIPGERIPVYKTPEAPARVLRSMERYARWRGAEPGRFVDFEDVDPEVARAECDLAGLESSGGWLDPEACGRVLQAFGLPVLPGGVARTMDEALELGERLRYPLVAKVLARGVTHKTDVGGVQLDIADPYDLRAAWERIRGNLDRAGLAGGFEGVLIQPMLRGAVELMAGVVQDPQFGPVMACGLGGIHVEVLGDVSFRITPLTDQDARDMIRSLRGHRLLTGYRGHPEADIPALEELLLRLSRLVEEVPRIQELDLNPVIALPPGQGCRILDARIRLGPSRP